MEKAASVAQDDLASIRTGPRQPGHVQPDQHPEYHGSDDPITQLSSINVPEAPGRRRHQTLRGHPSCAASGTAIRNSTRREPEQRRQCHPGVRSTCSPRERRRDLVNRPRNRAGRQNCPSATSAARRGRAGPDPEGRRRRRNDVARAEKDLDKSTHTYTARSTTWSKHWKANCWRSDLQQPEPWWEPSPQRLPRPPAPDATCPPPSRWV